MKPQTHKEKLQQRNRLGMVSRKTTRGVCKLYREKITLCHVNNRMFGRFYTNRSDQTYRLHKTFIVEYSDSSYSIFYAYEVHDRIAGAQTGLAITIEYKSVVLIKQVRVWVILLLKLYTCISALLKA